MEEFKVEPWDNVAVLELFKELHFKRFIERFNLENLEPEAEKKIEDLFEFVSVGADAPVCPER